MLETIELEQYIDIIYTFKFKSNFWNTYFLKSCQIFVTSFNNFSKRYEGKFMFFYLLPEIKILNGLKYVFMDGLNNW